MIKISPRLKALGLTAGLLAVISVPLVASDASAAIATLFTNQSAYSCNPHNDNFAYPRVPITWVIDECGVRVWLHQYANWQGRGWSYCVTPNSNIYQYIPSGREYPANIFVSSNTSQC
jgi:hypothetical protein